ncbi:hypothetical protein V5F77_28145 [Xanthobacter sp. DSM 24535]|uniref:glycine-rich domain-containing protein n=1 Tax=Roseixanthobacter psychrophilus TaxID=3119917 RepID=UPI003728A50B
MDRITAPGTTDIGGGRRGFRGRDALAGVQGTEVAAAWLNGLQEELVQFIERCGGVPDAADWRQLMAAIRSQRLNYFGAGGTANALTIALDPAPPSLAALTGVPLRIFAPLRSTGAAILTVVGVGAAPIVRYGGSALVDGDIPGAGIATVIFDGSGFQLVTTAPEALSHNDLVTALQPGMAAYLASGTFVPPANIRTVRAQVWGGAGGGGGSWGPGSNGGGGGGGGYAPGLFAVTPGVGVSVTVGVGGAGGNGLGTNGGAGGTSSFGAFATGGGGGGGGGSTSGTAGSIGAGGSAAGGLALGGMSGGNGYPSGTSEVQGVGGASPFGGGFTPPSISIGTGMGHGFGGTFPGGGGGGGVNGGGGGGGANGLVIITW